MKIKCYAHIKIKSKYFKQALNFFRHFSVSLAWIIRSHDNEIRFVLPYGEEILNLSSFSWGEPLSILNIHSKEGNTDVSISLPVICKKWDGGDRHLVLSSNDVNKLIKILPDDDLLIDFIVYTIENKEEIVCFVIKSDEFSVFYRKW